MNFDHLSLTDEDGNYHVPDPRVCQVASQLYELWPRMISIYRSSAPRISQKDMLEFYKAAKICIELELEPSAYLHRILRGMSLRGHYYTKLVSSRKMLEVGYEDPHAKRVRWLNLYRSQVSLFEVRAPIYGYAPLLLDDTAPFTPLFRCIMAKLSGVADQVIPKYKESARLELSAVPVAKDVFGEEALEFLL